VYTSGMENKDSNFVNALLSVAPALLQLFAFFAWEFSQRLGFSTLFLRPDLLTLSNISTLLISLSGIGLYIYRRDNYLLISLDSESLRNEIENNRKGEPAKDQGVPIQKQANFLLKILVSILTISSVALLFILSLKDSVPSGFIDLVSFFQWFTYIVSMTTFSISLFIWLDDVRRRSSYVVQREEYVTKILERLRDHGWMKPAKVHLVSGSSGSTIRQVVVEVDGSFLYVNSNYDASEIMKVEELHSWPLPPTKSN